jgi:dihydroorotate dehydrogenase (NAD+) catalytic subunit
MDIEVSPVKVEKEAHGTVPVRRQRMEDLVPLRNPLVLGSGPLGTTAKSLIKYAKFAGGVVSKTVTWDPCEGNRRPRVRKLTDDSVLNWEGVPNLGYKRTVEELKLAKQECPCPVIVSLWPGAGIKKIKTMAAGFEEAGADGIEVDFKWGLLSSDMIFDVCNAVKNTVSIPLIAKLSVFGGDICEHAKIVEDAGCDAITAINSIAPAMKIDVGRHKPVLSTGYGGLSGRPILPFAVAAVYELYTSVSVPIMGSGGVTSGEAALELIMAGADVIQICTIAMLEGPAAFQRILNELQTLVRELGFGSVEECRGLAHQL